MRSTRRRGWLVTAALLAGPAAFLAAFFVWPVAAIIERGLRPDGGLDLSPLGHVVTDARLRQIAWFTSWQAVASTIVTTVLALPLTWALARHEFRGRAMVRAIVTMPFVLPSVVVAAAFVALGASESVTAILAAHALLNVAVIVRIVGTLWSQLDPSLDDAARTLGAGPLRTFVSVTVPLLRPAVVAAASIVFLFCFSSFGVVLVLGGLRRATLETEIYRLTAVRLDLPAAGALALTQFVVIFALLLVTSRAQRRWSATQRLGVEPRPRPLVSLRQRLTVVAVIAGSLVLILLPLAMLVRRSFGRGSAWSLAAWRTLGDDTRGLGVSPLEATANSLRFAAVAATIAAAVGLPAAVALSRRGRAGALDAAFLLPLGTSAVTVGFGYLIALDRWPLDLRTSWLLVPLAQAVVALPFVLRTITPVARSIDPELRDAAATLGAGPVRRWWAVDAPILARATATAIGFAFAISLGEFGATAFIARPDTTTLPVAIFRALGRPGELNYGHAMAMSTVLMLTTLVVVLVVDRIRPAGAGEL